MGSLRNLGNLLSLESASTLGGIHMHKSVSRVLIAALASLLLAAVLSGALTNAPRLATTPILASAPSPTPIPTAATSTGIAVPSDFFTENAGQLSNPEVLYYTRGGGVSVGFAAGAVLMDLRERPPAAAFDPLSGPISALPPLPAAPGT